MDVQEKKALQILQGAFWVNPDDHLQEFKTKYRKWLLQGNHPDTGEAAKILTVCGKRIMSMQTI